MNAPGRTKSSFAELSDRLACGIWLAILCAAIAVAAPETSRGLTGAQGLARAYDLIMDARFDQAAAALRQACGPAPVEACRVLDAVSSYWEILLDPGSRALDDVFVKKVEAAIAATSAWTDREPLSGEAWFYLGGAYSARVQWRVLRGETLAAARDGKRIHDALQRAVMLDPDLQDGYFGLGLYHYYAAVAPAALRVLRWLLLLPGGDRAQGLAEMLRTQDRGQLLRGEADYQLHEIYLWYEHQPVTALRLLESLQARYSHNPVFPLRVAEVQDNYLHDRSASLDAYRALLEAARQGRVAAPALAEVEARLGMAQQLDVLDETDRAIDQLQAIVLLKPSAPYASLAKAQYRLGAAYDRLGRRSQAVGAYQAAMAIAPAGDPAGVRARARESLRQQPDAQAAQGYRLGLEAWRFTERVALSEAETAFKQALALRPADPVIHYRYARLLQMRKDDAGTRRELDFVLRARPTVPPTILAAAYFDYGHLLESTDQRRAVEMLRAATQVFGADARTRDAATQALRRLQSASPGR